VVELQAFREVGDLVVGIPGEAFDLASYQVVEDLVKINKNDDKLTNLFSFFFQRLY
jgi:hypothetical protein